MSFSGFPDWQRTVLWDGPSLYTFDGLNNNTTRQTPILDVSQWAYLGGRLTSGAGLFAATYIWYFDQAGSALAGVRSALFSSIVGGFGAFRYPNLGPYVQITLTALAAAAYTPRGQLVGTNRVHPLERIPNVPQLVLANSVNVNNGATQEFWPTDYYTGPLRVWTGMTSTPWQITLQAYDLTNTALTIDQWNTAGARLAVQTLAPDGLWSLQLTNNTGANNNVFLAATGSLTGAS